MLGRAGEVEHRHHITRKGVGDGRGGAGHGGEIVDEVLAARDGEGSLQGQCGADGVGADVILAIAEPGGQLDAVEARSGTAVGHPAFEDVASGIGEEDPDAGAGEVPGDAFDHRTRRRQQATVGLHVRVVGCLEPVGSDP
jgi:hypothetical protein